MIDPLSVAFDAALLGVGALTGWLAHRAVVHQPTCGCTHSLAFHDKDTGECAAQVKRAQFGTAGSGGHQDGFEYAGCACRQHVGTEPAFRRVGTTRSRETGR